MRDPAGLTLMLRGMPRVDEVVVVADADAAVTARAARPDAMLVRPSRPGIGNALTSGIAAARGDVIVTLNGDGSTDPAEIPAFVAALTAGADVAFGSRYRDGGRDLTGGRFRRWADLLLIWCVNALFGTGRTDPGFGYAAFWRDAVDRLDLPDPTVPAGATGSTGATGSAGVWGEGPEIGPLLMLRPAVRGLTVAEVTSVAYPPIRRAQHADRARLRHWVRAAALEYGHRRAAGNGGDGRMAGDGGDDRLAGDGGDDRLAGDGWAADRLRDGRSAGDRANGDQPVPGERTTVGHDGVGRAWRQADRRPDAPPIWAPAGRRLGPGRGLWLRGPDVTPTSWRSGHPEMLTGPDVQPRPAWADRPPVGMPQQSTPRHEVGSGRRRIQGLHQQPELRVINGEGAGRGTGRRGRLRAVKKQP